MALLAQHGYGKGMKIEKGLASGDLKGIIFSPKGDFEMVNIDYARKLKLKYGYVDVYFDPQFYLCNFPGDLSTGKLASYSYYESGMTRAALSRLSFLGDVCDRVFETQNNIGVSKYFTPTILFHDFNDVESQIAINFAYLGIDRIKSHSEDLMVSLCINEGAFRNRESMDEFLNTITLLDVKGFYIIIDRVAGTQKFTDISPDVLVNIMKFVNSLSIDNKFQIIMGYSDMLSLPFAAVSNADFACGWFNSLKRFSKNSFIKTSGGKHAKPRYTSASLMSSLLLIPELSSISRQELLDSVLSDSPYTERAVKRPGEWSDEISCLHNWHVLNSLICEIQSYRNINDRLNCLINKIEDAGILYKYLKKFTVLDGASDDKHLKKWLEAINLYKQDGR